MEVAANSDAIATTETVTESVPETASAPVLSEANFEANGETILELKNDEVYAENDIEKPPAVEEAEKPATAQSEGNEPLSSKNEGEIEQKVESKNEKEAAPVEPKNVSEKEAEKSTLPPAQDPNVKQQNNSAENSAHSPKAPENKVQENSASEPTLKRLLRKAQASITLRILHKRAKIMRLFATQTTITNDQVEKLLHVSDATATRYLDALEREGKIVQQGTSGHAVVYVKR